MQISSRFTIALHIFACVDVFKYEYKVTSDFLAGSINTNPVIIRKILSQLKSAGLITVARGTGGITVNKPLDEITFYDVYQAIEPVENGSLFHFHDAPNPACPVGRNIHALLDDKLSAIQKAMEDEMRRYSLVEIHTGIQELLAKES
ncbi:MAG: Rrf2 family transcriptional regulator [Oscillospiraceae bacterium]|nr:Rrf2 family transcriptional regulator [Oscillospiraceae bacterium]